MKYLFKLYYLFPLALASCSLQEEKEFPSLISTSTLDSLLQIKYQVKIIDVRPVKEYEQGHISGSLNTYRNDYSITKDSIEGYMPGKDQMEALIGKLGVEPTDFIVLYDDKGNPDAARLWWILQFYGHKRVAILNGGLISWIAKGKKTTEEKSMITPTSYTFQNPADSSLYANLQLVRSSNAIIIDARCEEEHLGGMQKGNAKRAGRIPGSVLIDYENNIDYDNNCVLKNKKELKGLYESNGLGFNTQIITYCQSGVRSALTTFVLTEILDYKNVRNYDGSWLEWSHYSELPIVSDATLIN